MLTPHTAGPLSPSPILLLPPSVTQPLPPQETQNTPQRPPRAVRDALYPHGPLPTPRFQPRTAPRDSTPATPQPHTGASISAFSPSIPDSSNTHEFPASMHLEPPLSTSTLAPHPLRLTFLITLPDPSFPSHLPPPLSSQIPSRPTASSLSPTLGILSPTPTFLLPSLKVPAEFLASWWDLPEELSRAEGNRALGWDFRPREVQEVRGRVSGGDDVAFALRWNGRSAGRRR